jgi:hypothetical protein
MTKDCRFAALDCRSVTSGDHSKDRFRLGSAPASGAADGALAVRTGRREWATAWTMRTRGCSARGRAEQQPGRLRSPFATIASYLPGPRQGHRCGTASEPRLSRILSSVALNCLPSKSDALCQNRIRFSCGLS